MPILGIIPSGDSKRRALFDNRSPQQEAVRRLRTQLLLPDRGEPLKTVMVTSAEPGEGKSTLAANFALVSSMSNNNVLLVDADLRQPVLHEVFGLPRTPGLVEVLATGSPVDTFVQPAPTLGHLDVLTAGRPIPQSADLASSKRMGEVLLQASEQYELVVLDSPPVLHAADAGGLASHHATDVVLVVTRSSKRRTVTNALRKLELIEANIAGIVVNRDGRLAAYGY
jgi:capsular exopolysaccharide synthesis family protein